MKDLWNGMANGAGASERWRKAFKGYSNVTYAFLCVSRVSLYGECASERAFVCRYGDSRKLFVYVVLFAVK